MLEVKRRKLHSITNSITKWENFTTRFPHVLNGEANGNIYYIAKK